MFINDEKETVEMDSLSKTLDSGNDLMEIISHSFLYKDIDNDKKRIGTLAKIKNISGSNIGSCTFSTVLYDSKGDILDTIELCLSDFEKDSERTLRIESNKADIQGYSIKVTEAILTPEPLVTGNDDIIILNHHIQDPDVTAREDKRSIDIAIRNISQKTFSTVVFDAIFYDSVGNIMSKGRHREYELKPDVSRCIHIIPDKLESDIFKSYKVSIMKARTTDIERIQLRRHEIRSIDGGEEIRGSLKNLSDFMTDAALIATFKDFSGENIGTKVITLENIEPHSIKNFQFTFIPPMREKVVEYTLNIGELVKGN